MVNIYGRRSELKDRLQMDADRTAALDDTLLEYLEDASRRIEDICLGRHFYSLAAQTRYYRGSGVRPRKIRVHDLISVTSLTVDTNDDGTYEYTLVEGTDYILLPETRLANEPAIGIELLTRGSQIAAWPAGQRSIKIVGKFGYSEETSTVRVGATAVTGTLSNDTDTTLVLSDAAHGIDPGEMLILGSEQVFAERIEDAVTLQVARGQNGTTAAAQNAVTVYRREYPHRIVEEVLKLAVQNVWANQGGNVGMMQSESGFSADSPLKSGDMYTPIRRKLARYIRVDGMVA